MSRKNTKSASSKRPGKEERLYQNLKKILTQFLLGKGYSPRSKEEIFTRLGLAPQHKEMFDELLEDVVDEGVAILNNGMYQAKKNSQEMIAGILKVHPRGFGFLQADDSSAYAQDIFIPKQFTQNAVDGDRVEVQVNTDCISEKGPEGRVIAILERARTHLAGTVRFIEPYGDVVAYVPLLGASQRVIVEGGEDAVLKVGDRIVMEVIDWGAKDSETVCRLSHILGHILDPSCDIIAAIEEHGLRSDFSSKVKEEAKAFGKKVSLKDIEGREDFRKIECVTIDPTTAKDFDDAISIMRDKKGHYHLGVHIADVSHYVHPGTELDKEAFLRCNSTYFPGKCIPMLPGELSENLCSLKEKVNRLTVSVLMEFDEHGDLVAYRIVKGVINSAKRFTYQQAKDVLDGKQKSKHLPLLNLMTELCALLKKKRYERGSIEFAMPELVVIVDDAGVPTKTDYVAYDITHQMVEEFMLKANEVVASHLNKQGKNLTYRVHDVPAEENMKDFSLLAAAFGFKISDKPTSRELQDLFDEAMKTSYGQYLATSYIRRMRLAVYSPENIGHYGLGLMHYCHFTSPIRRYVDLVAHRLLFGEDDNLENLQAISDKCSEQERISARAESSVVLLKKLRLLKTLNENDPHRVYEAVITKVKGFGFSFEVLDIMLEGFFHIADLDDDYYVFEESKMRLKGRRTAKVYSTGEKIEVALKAVDFVMLESSWYLVGSGEFLKEEPKAGQKPEKKKAKGKGNKAEARRPFPPARKGFKPKAAQGRRKKH